MVSIDNKNEIFESDLQNTPRGGLLPRPGETMDEAQARVANVRNGKRLSAAIGEWDQSQKTIANRQNTGGNILASLSESIKRKAKMAGVIGSLALATFATVEFTEHVLHNGVASLKQTNTPTQTQPK